MANFALQKVPATQVTYGSEAKFPTQSAHVGYPHSDRDSDRRSGRFVPITTKVQRSKTRRRRTVDALMGVRPNIVQYIIRIAAVQDNPRSGFVNCAVLARTIDALALVA